LTGAPRSEIGTIFRRLLGRPVHGDLLKVINEYPAFEEWLAGLVRAVAEEAVRRNLETPA